MVLGIDYSNTLSSAIMHVSMGCYDVCTVYTYVHMYPCEHGLLRCAYCIYVCTYVSM